MSTGVHLTLGEVLAALGLVVVALAIARWQRMELERDIAVAVVRSFVQLTAIGYVIKLIFDRNEIALVVVLIAAMALFGAFTATGRARCARRLPAAAQRPGVAGAATLGLVVALGVFPACPRYLVPVGGMIIGNAITAAAVTLNRPPGDRTARPPRLRSGVIPLIDSTKTTGLIFFPGTMVGMLLAGAAPIDAVRLQLVLLYVLLGGVAIATLIAVLLAQRAFFTPAHQLREPYDDRARTPRRRRPTPLRRP